MIPVLLIVIPLLTGLLLFTSQNENGAKNRALLSSIVTLLVSLAGLTVLNHKNNLQYDVEWMSALGSRFHVGLDGMGQVLCLLTALSFPLIFVATRNNEYK